MCAFRGPMHAIRRGQLPARGRASADHPDDRGGRDRTARPHVPELSDGPPRPSGSLRSPRVDAVHTVSLDRPREARAGARGVVGAGERLKQVSGVGGTLRPEMPRYAAFLRGVSPMNAKMPELARAFERGGFTDVKTVQSSGNVVFGARASSLARLEKKAEAAMEEALGRSLRHLRAPDRRARRAAHGGRFHEPPLRAGREARRHLPPRPPPRASPCRSSTTARPSWRSRASRS